MPRRWRWPPENSCGKRSSASGRRPTFANSQAARSRRSGAAAHRAFGAVVAQRLADDLAARAGAGSATRRGPGRRAACCAASVAHAAGVEADRVLAARSAPPGGRLDQAQDRLGRRRLAAARFADQAQRLASRRARSETPSTARTGGRGVCNQRRGDREVLRQPVDREQRRRIVTERPRRSRSCGTVSAAKQATTCAVAVLDERRRLGAAARRSRSGQRGANGAAGVGSRSAGTMPGISASRGASRVPASSSARHRAQQAARVGMERLVEQIAVPALPRPCGRRTSRRRVASLGDDAEVVRDQHDRRRRARCCSSRISSRICAWIVTSSAVVGSSAISSSGCRRAPSRSSRAGACRRRAGAGTRRRAARARGCCTSAQHLDGARSSASRGRACWCSTTVSAICSPTVSTGLSEVIGSWKIIAIAVAADRAHLAPR